MLLERRRASVPSVIEKLVGMQAQEPFDPYVGLWSRMERFSPESLAKLLLDRKAVRGTLMRGTIHLLTACDFATVWPVMRAALERMLMTGTPFGRRIVGVDPAELDRRGRSVVEQEPRSRAELRPLIGSFFPDADPEALVYAVQMRLPLVQVTPRAVWGQAGRPRLMTFEKWTGQRPGRITKPDALALRYLAAFGPATHADFAAWSRLSATREVFERLRPMLRAYRGPTGAVLYDIPRGPLPDPETPAPVRFLPVYDNVLLGHADRSRMQSVKDPLPWFPEMAPVGTILVDGVLRGTWRAERVGDRATLRVNLSGRPIKSERSAVEAEGQALLAFLEADTMTRDVRFVAKVWEPASGTRPARRRRYPMRSVQDSYSFPSQT